MCSGYPTLCVLWQFIKKCVTERFHSKNPHVHTTLLYKTPRFRPVIMSYFFMSSLWYQRTRIYTYGSIKCCINCCKSLEVDFPLWVLMMIFFSFFFLHFYLLFIIHTVQMANRKWEECDIRRSCKVLNLCRSIFASVCSRKESACFCSLPLYEITPLLNSPHVLSESTFKLGDAQ